MASYDTKSYDYKYFAQNITRNQNIWNISTHSWCKLEPYLKILNHDELKRTNARKDRRILIRKENTLVKRIMDFTLEFADDFNTFYKSNCVAVCVCLLIKLYCLLGAGRHHNCSIYNRYTSKLCYEF